MTLIQAIRTFRKQRHKSRQMSEKHDEANKTQVADKSSGTITVEPARTSQVVLVSKVELTNIQRVSEIDTKAAENINVNATPTQDSTLETQNNTAEIQNDVTETQSNVTKIQNETTETQNDATATQSIPFSSENNANEQTS
ncbi:hypothetical protein RFI_11900 [Reticulomyxa filosa]|uniref:Uncharacterized protein n=1 Tax=Reticulomyxa filosa TaxID=46433 RepID=X6NH65_RETFI|nr:hypothetical protein RFI_11900 [Reticulomyxa filosa]|eukprot:ETO25238.1 hypothetical protein RFI_11900 [Reticulomyxa filosa]